MSDCLEAADRGAEWLDGLLPEWYNLVNPDQLNIAKWECCVIGQLTNLRVFHPQKSPAPQRAGETVVDAWHNHGFLVSIAHPVKLLNAKWRSLIRERRANTSRHTQEASVLEQMVSPSLLQAETS